MALLLYIHHFDHFQSMNFALQGVNTTKFTLCKRTDMSHPTCTRFLSPLVVYEYHHRLAEGYNYTKMRTHHRQKSLFRFIFVIALLSIVVGISYMYSSASDRNKQYLNYKLCDWYFFSSDPKMAQLSDLVNRLLPHVPSEFLPEYRNPCWYASDSRTAASLRCLPYFFLIGFPKCGTTEIYQLLQQHPKFTGHQMKESHFLVNSANPDEDFEEVYLNGYLEPATKEIAKDPDKITGDLSPTYIRNLPLASNMNMSSDATPILFSTLFPYAKYIVSVRDPIDQVRSHFYFQLVNISTPKSNELHSYLERQLQAYWACVNDTGDSLWCVYSWHYWKYLETPDMKTSESGVTLLLQESAYYANLHLWLKHIKRENILIVQLEDMKKNIPAVANRIFTFLGLPLLPTSSLEKTATARPPFYQNFLHNITAQASGSKDGKGRGADSGEDPFMKDATKRMLCLMQRPFNKALANMLPSEHFPWVNSRYC